MSRRLVTVSSTYPLDSGWWLVWDREDGDFAVYEATESHDRNHVEWQGKAITGEWESKAWAKTMKTCQLTEREAEVVIMASRHFASPEQWYAYARHVIEKEDLFA